MDTEARITALLAKMTLGEKVGQMHLFSGNPPELRDRVRRGLVGAVANLSEPNSPDPVAVANDLQAVAVQESRTGIPLLIGRDVIHGFRTVFPIPLGQAASFDMALVEQAAAAAAREASACGIRWTFAPMVDVSRDPRWGRVAESGGEDTLLNARLGVAMVRGFQGDDPSQPDRLAACAKHYAGYGAAEGGRDYNTTFLPEGLLRDIYLPPFRACAQAGALAFMTAFNDLNGTPATGNAFLLRDVLKGEWGFTGLVVSDWAAIEEMIVHGVCADRREAAIKALAAGTDVETFSTCFEEHLEALVQEGRLPLALLDEAVGRILRVKLALGLFDRPYTDPAGQVEVGQPSHRDLARRLAQESCVLLKNDGALPLSNALHSLAVLGPLADAAADQLGCWAWDGRPEEAVTPLHALREALADRCEVRHAPGLPDARSGDTTGFAEALRLARDADAVVAFVGEDAGLSGEAHCRAFLDLPGAQAQLVSALAAVGKPLVVVLLTGRPLALPSVAGDANALLLAWHPGTMGGPALADLLLGLVAPSGKLPVSFPRTVGQVPLYYAHRSTARPAVTDEPNPLMGTPQDPQGYVSAYLDVPRSPLFPFGYGLSYTRFVYSDLEVSSATLPREGAVTVSVRVTNTGRTAGDEVTQLYVRDLVASVTRPVQELKDFTRVSLPPGETTRVSFPLQADQLGFHDAQGQWVVEPGEFEIMIGGSSQDLLQTRIVVTD